jgi:hypothetical protein
MLRIPQFASKFNIGLLKQNSEDLTLLFGPELAPSTEDGDSENLNLKMKYGCGYQLGKIKYANQGGV